MSRIRETPQSPPTDALPRLDVATFDAAMRKRGFEGVDAQAGALGISRSQLFRLRSGENGPSGATAIRIAEFCKLPVGKLFPPRAAA